MVMVSVTLQSTQHGFPPYARAKVPINWILPEELIEESFIAFVSLQGPKVNARDGKGLGGGVGGAFLNLSSCPVSSVVSFLVVFGNDLLELQNLFFF